MCFIKYVLRIPLRMSEAELLVGSEIIHGEVPYVFGPCEAHGQLSDGHHITTSQTSPGDFGKNVVTVGQDPHVGQGNGSDVQEVKLE
jgi:Amt family ammonium transporter